VILAGCLAVFILSAFNVFNGHELLFYDLRFKLRPAIKVSENIVIIEISDDSLKNLANWPIPRDFHASLVDVLKECGVRKIIFDVLFPEPTPYDAEFSRAIKAAGNVYLPLAFLPGKYPSLLAGLAPGFSESAAGIGHINVVLDPDGKIRKIPLFIKYNNELIPQLGFKAAYDTLGLNILDKRLSLPVMAGNYLLVNYPGRWEKTFKHLSYFEILKSFSQLKQGKEPDIDLSVLKDKVCFIGLTATGTSDFQPVPLGNNYPLVGLQASVFNSLIQNEFIRPAGTLINLLIALLLFALGLTMCLRFKPLKALLGSLILGLAYFLISTGLFIFLGIWIDLFLPLFIIFSVYVVAIVYRIFIETKKRELLEKELEIARSIQQSFLPQELKEFNGLDISSSLQPAKFVAGDLYDLIALDEKTLGLLIGDVSGKGVPASLIMAQAISLFRIFSRQCRDCAKVLSLLNKELYGRTSSRFVTFMYLIIDTVNNTVSVSSAGHAPLLVFKEKANELKEIELDAGLPLGVTEDAEYNNVLFNLEKGDKIIIFTDGLTEARSKDKREFGIERIKKVISENRGKKSAELSKALLDDVAEFALRCVQHDDITLIILGR